MMPPTAIVTGGTGFVGSYLVRRLVADGWNVHSIVRPESKLLLLQDILDRITLHVHDGSTNHMLQILKMAKPAVVFHLASLFLAQHEPKDIEPMMQSNLMFGTQLVEAMVANGVSRLINTGTSWQHYENKEYSPVCLYAATKQAFQNILQFYTEATPLKVITLKLFDTYGAGDPRPKLFSVLRKHSKQLEPLSMSPGEQFMDLVYIDDVVTAFILAARRIQNEDGKANEEFAVSSGHRIQLKHLVETYRRVVGKPLQIQWGVRPYRFREVMAPWNTGQRLPGWEPMMQLEEGIRRMEGME
ncbi:NAD(P)-dependent oxidoreductase [Fodinisporobacter ferrooxydans]|uniref:NAD(P)-dependent oxidoreductase n=1 Tax=Fodinisporobacter ferrooxydans TaxID=2901836 RepID=A0ABY4CHF3_9BACL|nr:NAD(P)-dependent oxidoreductase [Alicyclobacillaceae bacterium MYW30-H2]